MDSSRLLNSLVKLVEPVGNSSSTNPVDGIINLNILRRLLASLCYRDADTLRHSRRVGILSVGIGSRLGWEDNELRLIEIASLLHDIGKIGVPDHILFKPGKLSPDEAEYISSHHCVAVELLQACHADRDLIGIVAQSHGIDWNPIHQRDN
ncbi:MAG: HD domain-containing protein, partial [Planctomicrobium sp.]|nr:HD domain-containing protein [Planctomicrobium sp.]